MFSSSAGQNKQPVFISLIAGFTPTHGHCQGSGDCGRMCQGRRQQLSLSDLTITVLHTPGHTLGQVNYLVTEPSGETYAFTGDNIFLQSFGRPDLGR
jgi:hypothetical protein